MKYLKSLITLTLILGFVISGCGGGSGVTLNKQPVANAGNDIDINDGSFAQFDASLSKDIDGTITDYEWREGSTVLSTAKRFEKNDFSIGTHNITLDITDNKGATSSDQLALVVRETKLVFLKDDKHGIEPWMTNGTTSGTYLVKDINQQQQSSDPTDFVWVGDTLFFSAFDNKHGRELWISDGTTTGTRLLKDITPGVKPSDPRNLIKANNSIFFIAQNNLWKSDGTESGTILIKDFLVGYDGIGDLRQINGVVYFALENELYGRELWMSDGTKLGTKMLKDINIGKKHSVSARAMNSFEISNSLYFHAYTGTANGQLWKSDGTEDGTQMLKDITLGWVTYGEQVNVNGVHYFVAKDDEHGFELWKTDGTEAGTQIVKDIYSGTSGGLGRNRTLETVAINNTIYFQANDGVHGFEIWKTDGTKDGTQMVKDIYTGRQDSGYGHHNGMVVHKNALYFIARDGVRQNGLWKTDGTNMGTKLIKYVGDSERLFVAGGYIYFTDRDKLWKSDGTEGGTLAVKKGDLSVRNFNYESIEYDKKLADHNGVIYFSASDGTHGYELWKSDGTDAGTVMVKDINTTTRDSVGQYTNIYKKGQHYYFAAKTEQGHTGLWRTDGSAIGTMLVKDFNRGGYSYNPSKLVYSGDTFYFAANDDAKGIELWKSDGTISGTTMLKDIYAGEYGSHPQNFISKEGITYFTVSMYGGEALWKTDGTEAGTVSIYAGTNVYNRLSSTSNGDGTPEALRPDMVIIDGELYFSQINYASKAELWKSDGTNLGTKLIKTFGRDSINNLIELNGELYFNMNDKLWKSDGTNIGTIKVKDINTENNYASLDNLRVLSNKLYFSFDNDINGGNLWVSDGSSSGTKKVADTSIDSYKPNQIVTSGNLLYFNSYPNLFNTDNPELWVSDGTNGGTIQLKSSVEYIYSSFEDGVLFTTDEGEAGTALWRTNGTEASTEMIKALY